MSTISWNTPAWATQTSEDTEDVDEPPDRKHSPERFRRAPIRRASEQTSLLTKAIVEHDSHDEPSVFSISDYRRRRSMASNVSIASTADLTSDTGFTSPARTNTPSPPLPEIILSRINGVTQPKSPGLDRPIQLRTNTANTIQTGRQGAVPSADAPPKRCIQFACAGNPSKQQLTNRPVAPRATPSQNAPRRPCIKFACSDRPSTTQNTPPRETTARAPRTGRSKSPATPRNARPIPTTSPSTPRQSTTRTPSAQDTKIARPKYLRANSSDLTNDGSQFHEFASEMTREADWIRRDSEAARCKLTVNDTLTKENRIRRLATEVEEEEAELEEQDDLADSDGENEDDLDDVHDGEDDEDDEEDEDEEDEEEYGLSDGYYTDEETGFASSDESDGEEDGNMAMWTLSKSPAVRSGPTVPLIRTPSFQGGHQSDSSNTTTNSRRRSKMQRVRPNDMADLPDSTDFVCGTLDEDRPLEERYISSLAARRKDKLRVIPQDIDPSFPASEPEDEGGEDFYNPVHHESDDDDFQLPGEMEDLHHDQDRSRRRRKSEHASPRKYHSPPPPPKRHFSPPPPRARGRSPKNLFDRRSPRRMRSPAPKAITTPLGSPRLGNCLAFNLAARPGPTMTKSLPRPAAMFSKHRRHHKSDYEDDIHIRGAIDIVKGLERKRQRRKEKFYQKYCSRARRGQIPERKPQPGRGAERMKELGLLMAGKKDPGNYVLSV